MIRDDATETQNRAANPLNSTWVEANAGSGKTRVLTDRVARLLLEGVQPQHILCLTYTKAAASEMQNRLFKRLGEWAMLDAKKLTLSLQNLGIEHRIDAEFLARSRRLFAQAIEAPGGLKIQTIHSFCSSLLRRFPLEAGVSPQFTEIEDRAATLLRKEIVDEMALGPDKPLVDQLAHFYTGEDFDSLTAEILRYRDRFTDTKNHSSIYERFGLTKEPPENVALSMAFEGSEFAFWADLVSILADQSAMYQKVGARLGRIDPQTPSVEALEELFDLFLYKSGTDRDQSKAGRWPQANHKKAVEAVAPYAQALNAFMERLAQAKDYLKSHQAAQKSVALHDFANRFIGLYDRRKQDLGYLDFDDLIRRARSLLTDPAVAQWVLFRLDGGIDHILVDEAQDTSPIQWDVIELLAQEFTSGEGARADVTRTLFVVGDKKQSIYSFQGADPDAFDNMREEFGARLRDIESRLHHVPMQFSFRSSPAILNMVDHTFRDRHTESIGQQSNHEAFKLNMPGRVDLWPVVEPVKDEDDEDWTNPVDLPGQRNHKVVLASRIAGEIDRLLNSDETLPFEIDNSGKFARRKITPGDFLILVRGRKSGMFHQIIQACKERRLPIAGADRLKVGAELAVKDISALLSFLALQDDNFSLAAALRSPLFGWSEQDLFSLSYGRGKRKLWQVLRERENDYPETMAILTDLRNQADYLRPFELIERILTRHRGRANLLGRLGVEAEDGLDALLAQALAYESASTPSLTGFLVWMQEDELEIKRQMASDGDLIRVMTVHGAKGLEAPIVILPETTPPKNNLRDELLADGNSILWKTKSEGMPRSMAQLRDHALERAQREHLRLLYVAMTRAEKWLIVAGAGNMKEGGKGWYDVVSEGMDHAGGVANEFPTGEGRRYARGDWGGLELHKAPTSSPAKVTLPDWIASPAPHAETRARTLSPSDLGGPKALPSEMGMDEDTAKSFGSAVHILLEHLPTFPAEAWNETAWALLANARVSLPNALLEQAVSEAIVTLNNPTLADLFNPDTLAEVSITANLGDERIHGTIDRLIIGPESVTAIDFKTNRAVPNSPAETPHGLLRQMGAYAHALRQIYPDKRVQTEILWSAAGIRMQFPEDLVDAALQNRDRA